MITLSASSSLDALALVHHQVLEAEIEISIILQVVYLTPFLGHKSPA